jgi:hypothetical protein
MSTDIPGNENSNEEPPCIADHNQDCKICGFFISPTKPRSRDIKNVGIGTGNGQKVSEWCVKDEIIVAGPDAPPEVVAETPYRPKRHIQEDHSSRKLRARRSVDYNPK